MLRPVQVVVVVHHAILCDHGAGILNYCPTMSSFRKDAVFVLLVGQRCCAIFLFTLLIRL